MHNFERQVAREINLFFFGGGVSSGGPRVILYINNLCTTGVNGSH